MKNRETKKALIIMEAFHEKIVKQRRRYECCPYYYHLKRVAKLVHRSGLQDDNAIAAALLHDVVEDTPATLEDIETLFNKRVAHIVSLLTDPVMPNVNRKERKRFQRHRLKTAPGFLAVTVHTIKMADLYDNAKSIIKHDPDFAKVFMLEYEYLYEDLTFALPSIRTLCLNQINAYKEKIANEIERPTEDTN